ALGQSTPTTACFVLCGAACVELHGRLGPTIEDGIRSALRGGGEQQQHQHQQQHGVAKKPKKAAGSTAGVRRVTTGAAGGSALGSAEPS
ncbi:hypothetical protein MNEG_7816, partial [Monoraphidium neglectum]